MDEWDRSECKRELSRAGYLEDPRKCPGLPGDGERTPFNCDRQEKKYLG